MLFAAMAICICICHTEMGWVVYPKSADMDNTRYQLQLAKANKTGGREGGAFRAHLGLGTWEVLSLSSEQP
jgi:hypothetical protein